MNPKKSIGAFAALAVISTGIASAQMMNDTGFVGELSGGYHSDYIYRGMNYGSDLVDLGLSASKDFGAFGTKVGVWYGSAQDSKLAFANFTELNTFGELSKDFGPVTGTVGYIWRHFNSDSPLLQDSQDVYFGLSHKFDCGLTTSLTYFLNLEQSFAGTYSGRPDLKYDRNDDGYAEFAVSKSFQVHECADLVAGTTLGYYTTEGRISNITPSLTLNIRATKTVTVSPYIAYSFEGSGAENFLKGAEGSLVSPETSVDDRLYGGVRVAVSF